MQRGFAIGKLPQVPRGRPTIPKGVKIQRESLILSEGLGEEADQIARGIVVVLVDIYAHEDVVRVIRCSFDAAHRVEARWLVRSENSLWFRHRSGVR